MTINLKRGYIWNTVAGILNASEAIIMSMIVTRMMSLADAGILSIAFTIANQLVLIGKFGLRNYQVTDVGGQFSFSIYLKTRVVTVTGMMLCTGAYLGYAAVFLEYNKNKILIIFVLCMIYAVEAVEDVIWGYYQQRHRLDLGAQMFCVRWMGILLTFPTVLYISRDLKTTLAICLFVSLLLFFLFVKITYPYIYCENEANVNIFICKKDYQQMGKLLKTAFPLCGISVLQCYVGSAPRYAIDACLTDEVQACYGFVSMPVFAIRLLSNFIYQPLLVPMAVEWENRQIKSFTGRVGKQLLVVAGLSVICLAGTYWVGIPVLSALYHTNLSEYKAELLILLLGSGFMACVAYENVVLTIMRCQKVLLGPYCLVSFIAAVVLRPVVSLYGTLGASVCYFIFMVVLFLRYTFYLMRKLHWYFS